MSSLYNPYNGLYGKADLERIRGYMKEELKRSLFHLKKKKRPGAYYLSYLFRNNRYERITARLGSVTEHDLNSHNTLFCDVRVGSYRYDNVSEGGLAVKPEGEESTEIFVMPAEVSEDAFKYNLWRITDARYREAAEEYYKRKLKELHFLDPNRRLPARVKQEGVKEWKPRRFSEVDTEYWKRLLRKASALTRKESRIKNSYFEFNMHHRQSLLVNSEGSEILQQSTIFELRGYFWLLTSKGEGVEQELVFIEGELENLPSEREFLQRVKEKIALILRLRKAPLLNSYSGPVLLSPMAAGLFFHEVIGHRLEGSRLLSQEEGGTFRDLRGKRIAPDFIDIVDDPTQTDFQGRRLTGHYRFDDEGGIARRAVLVEKGILKSFLSTSAPLPGQKEQNGHARNQSFERPISRMANLFIYNRSPRSFPELWELFLEEIRRQKKPFGIYVKETQGGETETGSYDFQAFKGEILSAVRVYPDGREEPIRGVDFVGTPLSALDSVLALGDDSSLDNSYCGAESGVIPVSTVAPSMLMRTLELQSRDRERYTPYVLPLPYETEAS